MKANVFFEVNIIVVIYCCRKAGATDVKMAVGHPKMQKLEEIVVEHFKTFEKSNVFSGVLYISLN